MNHDADDVLFELDYFIEKQATLSQLSIHPTQ